MAKATPAAQKKAASKKTAATNANLHKAAAAKNDEFYTRIEDIEKELQHYKQHFDGKVVYCNCDDPTWSNFYKYFKTNFQHLNLKKLISTHYTKNAADDKSYKIEVALENGALADVITTLTGDGDFRSQECVDLLRQADIVCTNPPFSLFREYVAQLVGHGKKFLIMGNNNAITYKDIFKLIKDNALWLGTHSNKTLEFGLASSYAKWDRIDEQGRKFGNVPAISWFTNLPHKKRNDTLILCGKYSPTAYPKYDNYDAIEVSKVCDVPADYDGFMGVPITFLDKYNPSQFEIIGLGISSSGLEFGVTPYKEAHKEYRKKIQKRGAVDGDLYMLKGEEVVVPYARIVIRIKGEQKWKSNGSK